MPLRKGKSARSRSENIRELLHAYHQKGAIGNTTPDSEAHARRIAAAIADRVQLEGKR